MISTAAPFMIVSVDPLFTVTLTPSLITKDAPDSMVSSELLVMLKGPVATASVPALIGWSALMSPSMFHVAASTPLSPAITATPVNTIMMARTAARSFPLFVLFTFAFIGA